MDLKYRLFPHPVLWDKNDDFKTSSFDCSFELKRDIKKFIINYEYILDNDELIELINQNKIEFVLHIESPGCFYRDIKASRNFNNSLSIYDKNIIDKVKLCPFIVAKENIRKYYNSDFNDDYDQLNFEVCKGTILAIGPEYLFEVEKDHEDLSKVSSIFTIYRKETLDKTPFDVELNDHKIRIGFNITDYQNYYLAAQNKINIVNSFLIFPVLVFIFERLKNDLEDYEDYRWFKALSNIFIKQDLNLNYDLLESRTSIELAQCLMDNPISKSLSNLLDEIEQDEGI